jgi:hypothetical protein
LRFYFRLKAYFIFNCHFMKWPCISKAENIWGWLHFIPNGPGCQTFFTLYLGEFQKNDLGQLHFKWNSALLNSSTQQNLKNRTLKLKKDKKEKREKAEVRWFEFLYFQFLIEGLLLWRTLMFSLLSLLYLIEMPWTWNLKP